MQNTYSKITRNNSNLKILFSLFFIYLFIYLFIHYLQLGRHPVAGVVTRHISTDYKDFTLKFRYGGLHGKHVVATWNCREPSQHLLKDPGKPRKACVEMAGHRNFRVLTFSQSLSVVSDDNQSNYGQTILHAW